jgi:oligogalacturonide lyase
VRYADPATELDVLRITNPEFASGMAPVHLRQFGRRSDFLIYWSERLGSRQVCHLDLKSGESRQLTEVPSLDVSTISLAPDERTVLFFNGPTLTEITPATLVSRELYKVPEGSTRTGFTQGADGSAYFAVRPVAGKSQILRATRQRTASVLEVDGDVDLLMMRPRRAQLLYRVNGLYWLLTTDGTNLRKPLKLEPGQTGQVLWTPSGRTLVYLHIPDDAKELIRMRENSPDEGSDKELAKTTQFEAFGSNADASVFAGASRSKASSYVLIMLRVTKREMTLCEHRASDPAMVSPTFAPDSQSVYFVSDRHGKSALYRIRVEKFVEATLEN